MRKRQMQLRRQQYGPVRKHAGVDGVTSERWERCKRVVEAASLTSVFCRVPNVSAEIRASMEESNLTSPLRDDDNISRSMKSQTTSFNRTLHQVTSTGQHPAEFDQLNHTLKVNSTGQHPAEFDQLNHTLKVNPDVHFSSQTTGFASIVGTKNGTPFGGTYTHSSKADSDHRDFDGTIKQTNNEHFKPHNASEGLSPEEIVRNAREEFEKEATSLRNEGNGLKKELSEQLLAKWQAQQLKELKEKMDETLPERLQFGNWLQTSGPKQLDESRVNPSAITNQSIKEEESSSSSSSQQSSTSSISSSSRSRSGTQSRSGSPKKTSFVTKEIRVGNSNSRPASPSRSKSPPNANNEAVWTTEINEELRNRILAQSKNNNPQTRSRSASPSRSKSPPNANAKFSDGDLHKKLLAEIENNKRSLKETNEPKRETESQQTLKAKKTHTSRRDQSEQQIENNSPNTIGAQDESRVNPSAITNQSIKKEESSSSSSSQQFSTFSKRTSTSTQQFSTASIKTHTSRRDQSEQQIENNSTITNGSSSSRSQSGTQSRSGSPKKTSFVTTVKIRVGKSKSPPRSPSKQEKSPKQNKIPPTPF